jgi:hypothetical protein
VDADDDIPDGSVEWEPIEYGSPDGQDYEYSEQVSWLDDDEIDGGAERDDGQLPPHTTRHRVLVTLMALGLCLGGIGLGASTAYHRHVTDRRNADLLQIQGGAGAPAVAGLAALSFEPEWHAHLAETIAISVVNGSPDPVTLLSAMLSEPGLIGSARLAPAGDARVAPGKDGTLDGTVIADCTQPTVAQSLTSPLGEVLGEFVSSDVLSVRAETVGGTTGTTQLNSESTSGLDLQQRICGSQGYQLVDFGVIETMVDRDSHTITVRLPMRSAADDAVDFSVLATYTDNPANDIPGLTISPPDATSSTLGSIPPQAAETPTFTIKIANCPTFSALQPMLKNQVDQVEFQFNATIEGATMTDSIHNVEIDTLIAQACGDTP